MVVVVAVVAVAVIVTMMVVSRADAGIGRSSVISRE